MSQANREAIIKLLRAIAESPPAIISGYDVTLNAAAVLIECQRAAIVQLNAALNRNGSKGLNADDKKVIEIIRLAIAKHRGCFLPCACRESPQTDDCQSGAAGVINALGAAGYSIVRTEFGHRLAKTSGRKVYRLRNDLEIPDHG